MYPNYINDQKALGYKALKDSDCNLITDLKCIVKKVKPKTKN